VLRPCDFIVVESNVKKKEGKREKRYARKREKKLKKGRREKGGNGRLKARRN